MQNVKLGLASCSLNEMEKLGLHCQCIFYGYIVLSPLLCS